MLPSITPVAIISSSSVDNIVYTVTAKNSIGCYATGNIKVIVYRTIPGIFMPNAFTPNADGKNDVIGPLLAGIASLDYFKAFNPWGQVVFLTTQNAKSWYGIIGGKLPDPGAFVYIVQEKGYTGKAISKKGSFVLVR
ncbi:MAG: gliding motility-associated C-terminal domain-containing protein [Bacteroidota bacterium]